jgi:hypothetical protein
MADAEARCGCRRQVGKLGGDARLAERGRRPWCLVQSKRESGCGSHGEPNRNEGCATAEAGAARQPVNRGFVPFPEVFGADVTKCVDATMRSTAGLPRGSSNALAAGTIPNRRRIHAA